MKIQSMQSVDWESEGGKETLELCGEVLKKYNPRITDGDTCEIELSSLNDLINLEKELYDFYSQHKYEERFGIYYGLLMMHDIITNEPYLVIKDGYD